MVVMEYRCESDKSDNKAYSNVSLYAIYPITQEMTYAQSATVPKKKRVQEHVLQLVVPFGGQVPTAAPPTIPHLGRQIG